MPGDATDAEATFSLNLDGNVAEKAGEDMAALQALRQSISQSTDAIRQASAANRALRGSSGEVKDARAQLKALIDAERDSVSRANLALLKQGTTYEKLTQDARKLANEEKSLQEKLKAKGIDEARKQSESLGNAVRLAGGPVEELSSKFSALKGVLGGGGAVIAGLTLAVAAAVAGLAALTAAVVGGGIALARFIVISADAARNMNILRLATTKTEENARNLGTQVDALASKLSTPKDELNALAAGLGRTRLSGQAIVDTFNAVARASDAMGDDVGSTLKDIITRGQQFNRFQLNPLELQGKGISFQDVAGELAKNLKIGVRDAQQALFQGQVTIDQGAKALRQAVEKNFSKINDAKLLSLDSQELKLHEDLAALGSGVNLEPLLRGFAELRSLFSQSTVTGATLKAAITTIGDSLGPAFERALPTVKGFFEGAVIGALDVGIAFLKLGKATSKLIGEDFKGFDAVKAAEFPFKAFANAVDLLRIALEGANAAYRIFKIGVGAGTTVDVDSLRKTGQQLGVNLSGGLEDGIRSGTAGVGQATRELAAKSETELKDKLQIHSPSRVFFEDGADTAEGFEQGVRSGAPGAAEAAGELGGAPRSSSPSSRSTSSAAAASGGQGGGAGGIMIRVESGAIVIQAQGASGKEVAKELTAPSFLAEFTGMLQTVLKGAGIPGQAVPVP